jgi:hypothetical protein
MKRFVSVSVAVSVGSGAVLAFADPVPEAPPLDAAETRAFMRDLCDLAVTHHLKRDGSPQRGMMYEYVWWAKRGQPDGFIQGEALDTMHDGAWFANAMVHAYRATGDARYREVLVEWQLPFYLKMLNHGAELFSADEVDVLEDRRDAWTASKEWLLQGRENGFVPYWWDDGSSRSLEMLGRKDERPSFPCTNRFAGQANPESRLSGWSHGSSNHLAQDLAILVQQAWLLLRGSELPEEQALATQCVRAARNLQDCRARHGHAGIPAVVAACALTGADAELMDRVPPADKETAATFQNHFTRAVRDFRPGQKVATPGFADDAMYFYHAGLAKHRTLPRALALKLAFDAFAHPLLWQRYRDDGPVPPGMNRFDLATLYYVDGRPEHLASEGKGPFGGPVPSGSRLGPQNMAVCGWVLQAMAQGGTWTDLATEVRTKVEEITGRASPHPDVKAWLERELGGGLRVWRGVLRERGYIPTGIGCQSVLPGVRWDEFSDSGGYAHLITAAAQWLLYLDGKRDWEEASLPELRPP